MLDSAEDFHCDKHTSVLSSSKILPEKRTVRKRLVKSKGNQTKIMVPKAHVLNFSEESENQQAFSSKTLEAHQTYEALSSSSSGAFARTGVNTVRSGLASSGSELSDTEAETVFMDLHDSTYNDGGAVDRFAIDRASVNSDKASDTDALLPKSNLKKAKNSEQRLTDLNCCSSSKQNDDHNTKPESALIIALQISFPFLMAGMGMVAAGLVLDKVQHWEVFEKVPEIFILVPALLGLKGNLEMTLASRLSTYANRGLLDDKKKRFSIIMGNIILVEAQAMVIAFLASLVAMVLGWIPDGKWETNHAIILCCGSLLTGAIASCVLGVVMILVIVWSTKLGVNPDNVATPIAASLGDLITLSLLSFIVKGLYSVLYDPNTFWIGPAIIALFAVLTPLLLWLAHRNEFTHEVARHGWEPVIAAMAISSTGGFILDFAVSQNKGIAVFAPVINGVGGNLVAVQASRISTYLHTSGFPLGTLPHSEKSGCISPCYTFFSSDNPHSPGSRVMLSVVVPGQLIFLLTIQALKAGHTTITPQFVAVYIVVSILQVAILLQFCNVLVLRLWRKGDDPDNCAIPYLTALGDLLGTGLLSFGFLFLWLVGDRDADVGD